MRILFIRHGEPDYENDTLTETGFKQAQLVAERLKDEGIEIEVLTGEEGNITCATLDSCDTVVGAIVGFAGLVPVYHAVLSGKDIALANKETLVCAGHIIMPLAKEKGIKNPTQYWHLMNYCDMVDENKTFSKSIVCGELIFWMAEVSGAVPKQELESLLNEILADNIKDRKKWNRRIQEVCFAQIGNTIT